MHLISCVADTAMALGPGEAPAAAAATAMAEEIDEYPEMRVIRVHGEILGWGLFDTEVRIFCGQTTPHHTPPPVYRDTLNKLTWASSLYLHSVFY